MKLDNLASKLGYVQYSKWTVSLVDKALTMVMKYAEEGKKIDWKFIAKELRTGPYGLQNIVSEMKRADKAGYKTTEDYFAAGRPCDYARKYAMETVGKRAYNKR